MTTSDPDLGPRTELERLFREHYASLVTFATRYVGQSGEAEELVQDVFLALWRRRSDMPPAATARAYLFRAVHNRALNAVRHERTTRIAADLDRAAATDAGETAAPADGETMAGETEHLVQAAIARLPARCREIFMLSRADGLSYAEIARLLGISVKTVETQMGRALKALRSDLTPALR